LLKSKTKGGDAEIVQILLHAEGRLHDGDLVSDKQGRVRESSSASSQTYTPSEKPTEHESDLFATKIAWAVKSKAGNAPITVIADPKFLGLLKPLINAGETFSRDIAQWPDHKVALEVKTMQQPSAVAATEG